eukprot:8148623-Heterocapsa_arctica.AAC.1
MHPRISRTECENSSYSTLLDAMGRGMILILILQDLRTVQRQDLRNVQQQVLRVEDVLDHICRL